MGGKLADLIGTYRYLVILLTLFVIALAGYGASRITISLDYREFFAEDNPELLAFNQLREQYSNPDSIVFVIAPDDGTVFSHKTLSLIQEFTEQGWRLPYSQRVDSITNFQYSRATGDDLLVTDLVENIAALSEQELKQLEQIAVSDPRTVKRLISPSAHVTAVNVVMEIPNDPAALDEAVAAARDAAQQLEQQHPHIDVYLTGTIMLNNAFSEASKNDLSGLMPAMFLFILVTLGILLRSVSGTFCSLLVIAFSIITAFGLFGWFGWVLTPPVAAATTIIMTMAVADCVHILSSFLYYLRSGQAKPEALRESLRINLQPVFVTSLTTAVGFLSMNFSEVPPFRDLGNTVAIGVLAAFLLSVIFMPAMISALPVQVKPQSHHKKERVIEKLGNLVVRYRTTFFISTLILATALFTQIPGNRINDEFVKYFSRNIEFRQHTDFVADNLTGMYTLEYSLDSGTSNGVYQPGFIADVESFTDWIRTLPEVDHVYTLSDTFKQLNKNMHGDSQAYYRIPENRELAAQYLLLYELSLPMGLDLTNMINLDKSSTRVVITVKNITSAETIELTNRINDWITRELDHVDSFYTSSPNQMFSNIGLKNVSSTVWGTMLALIAISAILIVALGSLRTGLISLAPNLIPAGLAFGIWAILDGNLGISLGNAVGMTLGIVVDDTVHFLSKYQRARREQGLSSEDAVRYAFATVGTALWVTTLVLVAGFSVLSISDFAMNSDMGIFTALTISLALVIDFLFLPPLLILLSKKTS